MKQISKIIIVSLVLLMLVVACQPKAATPTTVAKKDFTFGVSWNRKDLQLIQAWEDYMKKIATTVAAEKGITINWVINVADGDVTRQASNIEDLISQGVDVIIARAEDGAAICSSYEAAKEAGIPFVTFDRAAQGCTPDAHVGADTFNQAVSTGETFADLLESKGVKGKCIELVGDLKDENAVNRTNGWAQVEKDRGAWETVLKVPTEYNPDKFISGTKNGFADFPDANCMFITTDAGWGLVQNSLQEIGKLYKTGEPGHIWIAAQDVDIPGYQGLMEGYMDVSTSYDAYNHAEALVNTIVSLAMGEKLENTVILVAGRVVTSENVRDTPNLWARDYGDYKGK